MKLGLGKFKGMIITAVVIMIVVAIAYRVPALKKIVFGA